MVVVMQRVGPLVKAFEGSHESVTDVAVNRPVVVGGNVVERDNGLSDCVTQPGETYASVAAVAGDAIGVGAVDGCCRLGEGGVRLGSHVSRTGCSCSRGFDANTGISYNGYIHCLTRVYPLFWANDPRPRMSVSINVTAEVGSSSAGGGESKPRPPPVQYRKFRPYPG